GLPSRIYGCSLPEPLSPRTFTSGFHPKPHFLALSLPGSLGHPRNRRDLAGRRDPDARTQTRIRAPNPGIPARYEVPGPRRLRRSWRPAGKLCGVSVRVRGRGGDQVVEELQAHIPPGLYGPLDGTRAEDVSSV
ncbi:hypothetical protein F2P56_026735, partial [Juglans regia]